jgi:hypothetical protein
MLVIFRPSPSLEVSNIPRVLKMKQEEYKRQQEEMERFSDWTH